MMKMKPTEEWFERPLISRIASVLYPNHCDDETRAQMKSISDGAGKKSPQEAAQALRNKR